MAEVVKQLLFMLSFSLYLNPTGTGPLLIVSEVSISNTAIYSR
jgi:hypothetical protein